MEKPRILFVYESKFSFEVKDGLWAALQVLKQDFDIHNINLSVDSPHEVATDFILGWGPFRSKVDLMMQRVTGVPKGLCIGSSATDPVGMENYDVLFYETHWFHERIKSHPHTIHAFGTNTDIYYRNPTAPKIWDWITVGSFSSWKRLHLIQGKPGARLAIGEIQKENYAESLDIIANILMKDVAVSDMVHPEVLAKIYNASRNVFIPALLPGGGERAVLEARACGVPVEVMPDNPKLMELVKGEIYTHNYYAEQLKRGIMESL